MNAITQKDGSSLLNLAGPLVTNHVTVAPLVSEDLLPVNPLEEALLKAYWALDFVSKHILLKNKSHPKDNIHNVIARITASSQDYPNLTRLTLKPAYAGRIAHGQLMHQTFAGLAERKHVKGELQSTHDLRVTEQCIAFYVANYKRDPSPETVLGWLFHDLVEDHGIKVEEIAACTVRSISEAVKQVSIPKLEELIALYPDLPKDKTVLKHRFKKEMSKIYTPENVILKFFDGLDAFASYINEMDKGYIHISAMPENENIHAKPPVFSLEKMLENLDYRREGNQDLIDRCRVIGNDPSLVPQGVDCSLWIPYFEKEFGRAAEAFERKLSSSAAIYDAKAAINALSPPSADVRHAALDLSILSGKPPVADCHP